MRLAPGATTVAWHLELCQALHLFIISFQVIPSEFLCNAGPLLKDEFELRPGSGSEGGGGKGDTALTGGGGCHFLLRLAQPRPGGHGAQPDGGSGAVGPGLPLAAASTCYEGAGRPRHCPGLR